MQWADTDSWSGQTAVLVAGGPSLSLSQVRAIGMARARDLVRVIAINDAMYPCGFADIGHACDEQWWRHHLGAPGFVGKKTSLERTQYPDVECLNNTGTEGFDPVPGNIRSGGNSGYQAIHLSIHLGVERIILVGYDMHARGGTHWFGDHPEPIRRIFRNMDQRVAGFSGLVPALDERGIAVVNCSPGSALKAFPMGSLESEMKKLQDRKSKEDRAPQKDARYLDRMARPQSDTRPGYRTK